MIAKRWPYCMKKKRPVERCSICGTTRETLLGKTMPGLYKGKCHPCYVLMRKYKSMDLTMLARARMKLSATLRKSLV